LKKDTIFNSFVNSATWNDAESRWTVTTKKGDTFKAKYLSLNTGFAAKRYIPDWKGIESFKGTFLHPSYWPREGIDLKGKKVALIGTGATGVQISSEIAPIVDQLVVFQRTLATCLPMKQVNYQNGEQAVPKKEYQKLFDGRGHHFSGFDFNFLGRGTFDDDPKKRQETYEQLWAEGDFRYWVGTYDDMLFSADANREAYNFWRDKTRARINDPRVRDLLAPMEQPYSFGCKRIPLEQTYFDIFNDPRIHLVDSNATPIEEITENGIKTSEKEWDFDVIICATGYDAFTGGLRQMNIRGLSGESLDDHWKDGTYTQLGITVAGFPNMFFTYGPQAPTAFCNGPTCAELQGKLPTPRVRCLLYHI
jgi:cation diffusion facilitator CzcD-associated flavoprotein CzcO